MAANAGPDPEPGGCGHCWPTDADAAWAARAGLEHERMLVDESHFIVTLLRCPRCTQAFLSVMTETIDWADGEDPQFRTLLPLTAAEAAHVLSLDPLRDVDLVDIGRERRSLAQDFPKEGPKSVFWQRGSRLFPHD